MNPSTRLANPSRYNPLNVKRSSRVRRVSRVFRASCRREYEVPFEGRNTISAFGVVNPSNPSNSSRSKEKHRLTPSRVPRRVVGFPFFWAFSSRGRASHRSLRFRTKSPANHTSLSAIDWPHRNSPILPAGYPALTPIRKEKVRNDLSK